MEKSLENVKNQLLLISAANGESKNVQKYINEGAYLDIKDANGFTPLHCACYNKHLETVKILVNAGANVNLKDTHSYGFTPLHFAASFGQMDLAKVILQTKQTDIHEVKSTQQGKTATELASTQEMQALLTNDLIDRSDKAKVVEIKKKPMSKVVEEKQSILEQDSLQQQGDLEQPEVEDQLPNTSSCCKSKCFKKWGRGIAMFLFLFFPLLHLWFTPYGFPLFIYPCGVMLLIVGLFKLKKKRDLLKEKNVYALSVHGLVYVIVNGIFIWSNIWGGGFPWSFVTLLIGSLFLGIHALKSKYSNTKYNKGFYVHALFFTVFALIAFSFYIFGTCNVGSGHNYRRYSHGRAKANGYPSFESRTYNHHYKKKTGHKRPSHGKWIHKRPVNVHYSHHSHHNYFCNRNIFGFGFFMAPVFLWGVILLFHYLKFKKVKALGCCGYKMNLQRNVQNVESVESIDNIQNVESQGVIN